MAGNLNKVMLIGRLGRDPEVRYTKDRTPVANLRIATTEQWKDQSGERQERTEWHTVVLWGRQAEVASEYLKKGRLVYVEGSLQTRKWQDQSGADKYSTEVRGNIFQMLDRADDRAGGPSDSGTGGGGGSRPPRRTGAGTAAAGVAGAAEPDSPGGPEEDFGPPPQDDDIPF